jgi:O-antigen ligase
MNTRLKINTASFLAICFLMAFFCAKTFTMPDMMANGLIAFTGLLCLAFAMLNKKLSTGYLLTALMLSVIMVMCMLFNGNASSLEVMWIWCYLGAALILAQFNVSSKTLSVVLIIVTLIYGRQIVLGVDATDAIGSGSGNNISTYILFYVILLYMKRYEENKSISYWPCIIAIILSIWGNGRAGILASGVLFVLIFFYDYIFVKKAKPSTLIKITMLALIALVIMYFYFDSYIEDLLEKFDRYGYSSVRMEIWSEYFNSAFSSIGNFFFGVPPQAGKTPLLFYYSGNPHNAFIMLHSKFGFIGVLCVLFLLIRTVARFLQKKEYVYLILIVVWFIRSMFDWTGFPGIFDVLFFYFVIKSGDSKISSDRVLDRKEIK